MEYIVNLFKCDSINCGSGRTTTYITVITNLLCGFVTLYLMEHSHLSVQAYFKKFGGQV